MNRMLHGKAVSGGIAFGDACRINDGASEPTMPSVIIASTIDPQTLAEWDQRLLLGIALESEDVTGVAEIARELDIPAVFGLEGLTVSVFDGNQIIIDGYRG